MQEDPPSPMVLRYFLILFLVSILLVGRLFWPFLSILIFAYLLTSVFLPVYRFFNRRLPDYFASFLTCALVTLLVAIPLTFLVISLAQEAQHLYEWGLGSGVNLAHKLLALQESPLFVRLREIAAILGFPLEPGDLTGALAQLARAAGLFIYNQISQWAANILVFLVSFTIMIFIIFYLLVEHDRLLAFIFRLSPLPEEHDRLLFSKFDAITDAVLVGNGICALIQGVLGGVIFAVYSLGPPVLWGLIMAVLAFLPIVGISLVLIPAALFLAFKGNLTGAFVILALYGTVTVVVEYYLKMRLVGSQINMHILLVFLSILGGLSLFGLLGIIYGPLIIILFLTLTEIYFGSYERYVKHGRAPEP